MIQSDYYQDMFAPESCEMSCGSDGYEQIPGGMTGDGYCCCGKIPCEEITTQEECNAGDQSYCFWDGGYCSKGSVGIGNKPCHLVGEAFGQCPGSKYQEFCYFSDDWGIELSTLDPIGG